jgi:hypothetical protein
MGATMVISEKEKAIQACLAAKESGKTGSEKIDAIIAFLKADPFVTLKGWREKFEKLPKEEQKRIEYDAEKYEKSFLVKATKSKEKIKIFKKKQNLFS